MLFFPLLADSVIFYMGEAEVYRSVRLKGGETFRVGGLPADMSNFRVWPSSGYVLSYSLADTVLPSDRERYDSLRLVLRLVDRKLSRVNARYSRLKYEKDLLLSYLTKNVREPAKALLSLSNRIERNSVLMDSLKAISDSLARLKKELSRQIDSVNTNQTVLTVNLKGFKGGKLFVSYRVQASWKPLYVFRVHPDGKRVKMEAVAEVSNYSSTPIATGRAVVTTSPPPVSYVPEHRKWVLRDIPRYYGYPPPPSARALESEEIAAVPEKRSERPPVQRAFTYISTRYEYRGRIRLAPMGRSIGQIPLFKRAYKADYFTVAYPEIGRRAYINAVFTPDEDLAPGRAQVYLDNELTATFSYDGGRRGLPDTLFAGYDPFITGEIKLVSQKRKDKREGKKYFTVETRVEEIVVRNGRKVKMPVVVYVRKPFAGGNVVIERVKFRPKPKKDLGNGLMMWEVELKPEEKFAIRREIKVKYPKGATLNW